MVAKYGDTSIRLDELDRDLGSQLFELRSSAIFDRIVEDQVNWEARKLGITPDQFFRAEANKLTRAPEESELRREYDKRVLAGDQPVAATFEAARDEILDEIENSRRTTAMRELREKLLDQAHAQIDLNALGKTRPVLETKRPSTGSTHPKIIIHEYVDLTSSFCADANLTLQKVLTEFGDNVRIVFKQKPDPKSALSKQAAEAALCAQDQGQYTSYRQAVFENQGSLSQERLLALAAEVGMDPDKFGKCVKKEVHQKQISEDVREAAVNGFEGTPAFSVNGVRLSGAHPFSTFARLIRFELGEYPVTATR
ncbi:MAG: thioredoxin domain-containing protein [Polyangiaceae bacterium]|nr:thioredoxin domain-containing protein [Polyangiaceae bacterium]